MTGLIIKILWGKFFDYGSSSGGVSASSLGAPLHSLGGAKKKRNKK